MATETELETLAEWLGKNGFSNPRRRAVTLSYLRLAFGSFTAEQLKCACQILLRESRAAELESSAFRWHPLQIAYLARRGGENYKADERPGNGASRATRVAGYAAR